MGQEFGQPAEWDHDGELAWDLLDDPGHAGLAALVADLNRLHATHPALHRGDHLPQGFTWIDGSDAVNSVIAFRRRDPEGEAPDVICITHFTPVVHDAYRVGVPEEGVYDIILGSDDARYGGSDVTRSGSLSSEPVPQHGHGHSVVLKLPPLAAVWLQRRG